MIYARLNAICVQWCVFVQGVILITYLQRKTMVWLICVWTDVSLRETVAKVLKE